MINLLPPDAKAQISAARANRLLLRYNIILLIAVAFLLAAIGFVYLYLGTAKAAAETAIADNIAKVSDYAAVEAEANSFRQDLTNAKQILDSDVTYTKVILEIASLLPPGIVLDTLSLDSTTFGTPTTLAANARDYSAVLSLKDSLQNSTLFSDVSIQTISNSGAGGNTGGGSSSDSGGGGGGAYPLTATLSVTIRKDAAQ